MRLVIGPNVSVSNASGDVVQKYLNYFKADSDTGYSALFHDRSRQYWDIFHQHYEPLSTDSSRAAIYKLLEFLRYMKDIKVNPFARPPIDPITRRGLNADIAYREIASQSLRTIANKIAEDVRKLRLRQSMLPSGSQFYLQDRGDTHVASFTAAYIPKTKTNVNDFLRELKGVLYNRSTLPPELCDQLKDNGRKVVSQLCSHQKLLHDLGAQGWLLVKKVGDYKLYARRAKSNTLVFKFTHVIPKEIAFGSQAQTSSTLIDLWKRAQPKL